MNPSYSTETLLPLRSQFDYSLPVPQLSPFNDNDASVTIRLEIPTESPPRSQEQGEHLWYNLDQFYLENKEKIESSLDVTSRAKGEQDVNWDIALNGFMQTANIVLDGLVVLGNLHPVLGVAIFAFHGVVKLDIARRDNDKKVLTVVLQMQNMMSAMFQLRDLKRVHLQEAGKNEEKSALQRLVEQIAQDITSCRSDLAYYSKRKFISKLIKSKSYEQIFADHIQIFALRRSELQMTVATYIATGIDSVNLAIIDVGNKLETMDKKFEAMIFDIFRKLDSPHEKKVFDFLDKNGGPQKCVDNPDLLRKLLSEAGESISTGKTGQADFTAMQSTLKEELVADLKQVLDKNQAKFERLLNVQNNNMKRISEQMEDQGQVIYDQSSKLGEILSKVNTVMVYEEGKFRKKAVTLKDPEIQQVWERMGLDRRSVKAKHFVLTFRDHVMTGYSIPSTPRTSRPTDLHADNLLFSEHATSPGGLQLSVQEISVMEESRWSLEYIDAAYVQPIVEAMDDDGSGFISVQEASKFALARPKELSLLHWMAYWAAGWHLNLSNYRWNIYSVLVEMHELLPLIHIANRTYIDDYLGDISFRRVESLLRSIRPLPESAGKDPKLCEMTISIASAELRRLNANLKELSFLLESAPDVADIGGEGRLETWILPLLFLVLKRHLAIMKIGQKIVLDADELIVHSNSLTSIFSIFDERMRSLEAKFRQVHRDVDAQFETFAYGMFFTSFKRKEYSPSENTTLSFRQADSFCHPLALPDSTVEGEPMDLTILAKPRGPQFEFKEDDIDNVLIPPDHIAHPMEGSWTCLRLYGNPAMTSRPAPILFNFNPITGGKIEGKGISFMSLVDLTGSVASNETVEGIEVQFRLSFPGDAYRAVICKGHYLPDQDIINGYWDIDAKPEAPNPEAMAPTDQKIEVTEKSTVEDDTQKQENAEATANTQDNAQDPKTAEEVERSATGDNVSKQEDAEATIDKSGQDIVENDQNMEAVEEPEQSTTVPAENKEPMRVEDNEGMEGLDNVARATTTDETTAQNIVDEVADTTEGNNQDEKPEDEALEVTSQADSSNTTQSDAVFDYGNFTFRRTPPDVIRFRYALDSPLSAEQSSLAKRRWEFAISAILERVQKRMGSAALFRNRMADRRKWIELSVRLDLADRMTRYSFHRSFSDEAIDEWAELVRNIHPRVARTLEAIASYWTWRDIFHMGGNLCDVCRRIITFVRYQCITCIREDMSNQVDFCTDCYDMPSFSKFSLNNDFAHKPSHSLIRSTRIIHKYELTQVIPNERSWSEKLKKRFQGVDMNSKPANERENKLLKSGDDAGVNKTVAEPPPRCGSCDEEIELPCFVCVQCALFFICLDCQRDHIPLKKDHPAYRMHSHTHPLLRIHDSNEVRAIKSEYDQIERQLEDMEVRINEKFTNGLSVLERKIARQLKRSVKFVGASEKGDEEGSVKADPDAENEDVFSDVGSLAGFGDAPSIVSGAVVSEEPNITAPEGHKQELDAVLARSEPLESKENEIGDTHKSSTLDDRIVALEAKVEERLNALEAKMDGKLGVLISLLQQLVPPPES